MEIERVSKIGYDEFVEKFLSKNLPCLLDEKFTRNWRSRQEWVNKGKPCLEFLTKSFGEATVPVADCNEKQFQSHPKLFMMFKDFIEYWKGKNTPNSKDTKSWYLKDWHFCKQFPDYKAYETPVLFKSDWLNEFWDQSTDMNDDYRFVYMGPQKTWTPFHADVFRSYSWSANICGHKKWILYPPGSEKYLRDDLGNLVFDVTSSLLQDPKKFRHFHKAPQPYVVNQKEGEIMFVPSCWYHQVINMEDTISINHNWINGCGVLRTWKHLKDELQLVKRSIDDCREMDAWEKQCQVILEANSGINYETFFKFLCSISSARIRFLARQFVENSNVQDQREHFTWIIESVSQFSHDNISPNTSIFKANELMYNTPELCLFDLNKIKDVLEYFVHDEDVDEKLQYKSLSVFKALKSVVGLL